MVKEDLFYDGKITIHRGKNFREHLKFVKNIREDYRKKLEKIEFNRIDMNNFKGSFFIFRLNKKINPKNFVYILNQKTIDNISNPFKINAFFMYKENDFYVYDCVDLHTGGDFYMQVAPSEIIMNLNENTCGNTVLRFLTNLQRYFSISVELEINDEKWEI